MDEDIYFHNPCLYLPNIYDEALLEQLRRLEVIIVTGKEDILLSNNEKLSHELLAKRIHVEFFIWEGHAHRAKYWREMVKHYL